MKGKGEKDRQRAYEQALEADVDPFYAEKLLDPDFPREPAAYVKGQPPRPVLAKERTAFVYAPF